MVFSLFTSRRTSICIFINFITEPYFSEYVVLFINLGLIPNLSGRNSKNSESETQFQFEHDQN